MGCVRQKERVRDMRAHVRIVAINSYAKKHWSSPLAPDHHDAEQ